MKAKSIKGKSTEEIEKVFNECLEDGFKPTLAFAFISKNLDTKAICKLLDSENIAVFGSTTNGEFIDEEIQKESAAILLLELNKDYFQIYFEEYPDKNYKEIARNLAQKGKDKFASPAYMIAFSHIETDGEEIIKGFVDVNGADVNVFGGIAGDDYSFADSCVFTNNKDSLMGMVCLALDEDKISIQGIATCGWKAVGTEKTVTKSDGNHVYTVDDVPVLDITVKYGGLTDITPGNKDVLIELAANFPLQLQRGKGDPVMRPALIVDWSDRSFYTGGTVPQGSKVRFSVPPDFDVMEKVIKGVEKLKETKMPEADALVVFSCAGRLLSLGPMMPQELEGIKNVWNAPMVGMFSSGELARATGGNLELHNLTTSCVALKEK